MNNVTTTSNTTFTGTGVPHCQVHGYQSCNCSGMYQSCCSSCGHYYNGPSHICGAFSNLTQCPVCSQFYTTQAGGHYCPGSSIVTIPYTWNTTGTFRLTGTSFKEVEEIATGSELTYEWNGGSFDMKLPSKFNDCFLKVGYTWAPLYPLIFSALENDETTISFHMVVGITDKVFEGDKVILKAVTTTKIEDNLTLVQLLERARAYLKKDA